MTLTELSDKIRAQHPLNTKGRKRSKIYGHGTNDADYTTQTVKHGTCPAYKAWTAILQRVYSKKRKDAYADATCCEEWHSFMSFRKWWRANHKENCQIDKDLLTQTKEYGPASCVFVPSWLNNIIKERKTEGTGVTKNKKKFRATCCDGKGKNVNLGSFETEIAAKQAWRQYKIKLLEEKRNEIEKYKAGLTDRLIEKVKESL